MDLLLRLSRSSSIASSCVFAALALSTVACGTVHAVAHGSAIYATTPPETTGGGALPLDLAVCTGRYDTIGISAASGCVLQGHVEKSGRYGVIQTAALSSPAACVLPAREGTSALTVDRATATIENDTLDLAVSGTTTDQRYVAYRFLGHLGGDVPSETCDRIMPAPLHPNWPGGSL